MQRKIYIHLIVWTGLLVFASTACAQDEQWLQYHFQRQVRLIGQSTSLQILQLSEQKPAGVELPQFKGQNQLFAKWYSSMVKSFDPAQDGSGYLWIALDRTQKNGLYNLLFIDSNGNGRLNDETAETAYRTTQNYTYFGPVKVVFQLENGSVTYHLNFRFYSNNNSRRLYASSGGWYEGDITVGEAKRHCVLFDNNANGTFNDKSPDAGQSDRIRIGTSAQDVRYVGNFIEVDGTLYRPEIARDGASIKLTKAEDVKFGNIRLPGSITEFSAGGENGLFTSKPKDGLGRLPIGRYRAVYWAAERKDEQGTQWRLQGNVSNTKSYLDISEGRELELSAGEPIVARLTATVRTGSHYFSQNLVGQNGERIELTRNGTRPQAPKLRIKNKDGTFDRTYSFSYG